jgi:hypothetical protein
MKLTIELVPQSCWYSNVRSNVSKAEWDKLRAASYRKARFKCEICGGKGSKWPVECHEVWHYNEETRVQKLVRMIALCPPCHEVKHIGLARIKGNFNRAVQHLMKVNDMTEQDATDYIETAFRVWSERSKYNWELDITFLDNL